MPDSNIVSDIKNRLAALADPKRELVSRSFFKTGPGQYGEGDIFRGISVPALRLLVKEFHSISLGEAEELLHSPFHEDRLLALLILVRQYSKADEATRKKIYQLYLNNTRFINNWDLVDSSAEQIVGAYLREKDRKPLYRLAKSRDLWERRIAIVATYHYIKRGEFGETLKIGEMLLADREDLIHKAVGWMLREVGKRDEETEEEFLREHCRSMPRTMLRYAIEKFPDAKRKMYMMRDQEPGTRAM